MKKILTAAIVATALLACNAPNADEAKASAATEVATADGIAYNIDTTSTVTWTGTKPNGSHVGTFKVKDGELTVANNTLVGGKITIDVASLQNVDLAADPENKAKLEGHLKSPDFFDVAQFPTALFEITSVVPFVADSSKEVMLKDATHTITGNLTLKGKSKSITFPAKVTVDASTAAASADFNIDRTEWEMNYKGPGNPQDWVISKTVNIKLNLAATKK